MSGSTGTGAATAVASGSGASGGIGMEGRKRPYVVRRQKIHAIARSVKNLTSVSGFYADLFS
jgi:hypothetical protein